MTTLDDARATIAHVEEQRNRLEKALVTLVEETPEVWGQKVREAVRVLVENALPKCLPRRPARPEEQQDCDKYAALSYTLAAEIVRFYPNRQSRDAASALSRGLVLDLWDMWWSRAGGIEPGEESRSPASQLEESVLDIGIGYIIDPMVLRSVFSTLDDDLARIFHDSAGYVDEEHLYRQGIWLLQRLHRKQFRQHERVVLYEFLRLRHWRQADREIDLPLHSLEQIIKAAQRSKDSLDSKGRSSMPTASEDAFRDGLGVTGQDEDVALMLETLQILRSVALDSSGVTLKEIGPHLLQSANRRGIKTDRLSNADMTALLRRLAARSRLIRGLCSDLLGYDFPTPSPFGAQDMPASAGCDCWISVLGYRRTGKTTFMKSLVAALMPDGSPFDEAARPPDSSRSDEEEGWLQSRARIVSKDDFADSSLSPKYADIFKDESVKIRFREEMDKWVSEDKKEEEEKEEGEEKEGETGTSPGSKTIAEIRTPHMARLRFFDLAGERIFKQNWGQMEQQTREMIAARKPVATIYMDSEDQREVQRSGEGEEREIRIEYDLAVKDAFTKKGPVYIVFNKADKIRKQYEGEALAEIDRSIGHQGQFDRPEEYDADYDPDGSEVSESFFSTRRLRLPVDRDVTHLDILACIDESPAIVRRPFFHDRLREDIRAVKKLLDTLLAKGHRDISFVYLVSTRDGRATPEALVGTRWLWADIEKRVLTSTRNHRRASLRKLLETDPAERLEAAATAYAAFDVLFRLKGSESVDGIDENPALNEWTKDLEDLEKLTDIVPEMEIKRVIDEGRRVKYRITMTEHLKGLLDDSICGFLPELGFLPDIRKSQIEAIARFTRIPPDQKKEIEELAQELAKQGEKFLEEKRFEYDKGRMCEMVVSTLMHVIRGVELGGDGKVTEEIQPGCFDFDQGSKAPIDIGAGSLLYNGNISVAMKDVIGRGTVKVILNGSDAPIEVAGDWSFLQGLLATNFSTAEKKVLADALYNFCSPEEARYPELNLKIGDHDFYRTRILTSQDQLATELRNFRKEALMVLDRLLTIRDQLYTLDLVAVLNLAMARVIHPVLGDNELPPIEELVGGSEQDGVHDLDTLCQVGRQLADEIEHSRINDRSASIRDTLRRPFKSKATIYAELYQRKKKEEREVWRRLDPTSHEKASIGYVSHVDAYKIRSAGQRINARIQLYSLLHKAVRFLHGNKEMFDCAVRFLDDPTFGLDTNLGQDLCRLHVRRMYLVNVYSLLYLDMAWWVQDSTSEKRIEQSLTPDALDRLNKGAIDVWRKFKEAFDERLKLVRTEETTIGRPFGNVQEIWEQAVSARKDFMKLLLDEAEIVDSIWGPTL